MSSAFAIRGIAALVQLALLPAYMRFFGNQAILGVWLTVVGLLSIILNFDIGISSGLRNKLAFALGEGDRNGAKKYISSAYVALGGISLVFALLGIVAIYLTNWNAVFNIAYYTLSPALLTEMVGIVLLGLVLKFFLNLISAIFFAIQMPALNNLMSLSQSVFLLIFLHMVSPGESDNNFRMIAWANAISMNIFLLIATVIAFMTKLKDIRPSISFFCAKHARSTLGLGAAFFYLQMANLFIMQIEIFIIRFFLPDDVVEFTAYIRVFTLASVFVSLLMSPAWSAITEAMAQKRHIWVWKLYKAVFALVVVVSIMMIAIIPFLDTIFRVWLGEHAPDVIYSHALMMAFLGIVNIWISAWHTMTIGMGILKPGVVTISIAVILKLPLTVLFASMMDSWISIVLAYVLISLPTAMAMPIVAQRNIKRKMAAAI